MIKEFPIEDVLTVVTGIMLKTGADFQGVMDHLYPGIMTIGCAAMQPTAAEEIQRQHPKMREFCRVNKATAANGTWWMWCDDFVQLAGICFGRTIAIEGPHEVSDEAVNTAFDRFIKGVVS